ncbi:MAG TPA: sulfatase-like hydrolase/transferase, partial [Solirubrobacterales bacterium]|nr:sulfatase-like hydrolase/transferase [Solirubrobacterales bacterium]
MNTFAPQSTPSRAPQAARLALAASFLVLLVGLVFAGAQSADAAPDPLSPKALQKRAQQSASQKPSFVVIQTDDATIDQLYETFSPGGIPMQAMPYTLSLIAGRGITFNRFYVPYPLCCPSRVSLLTGRYAHNHNVRGNVPPNGGFTGFKARQAYSHNLAPWLQQAGYRTIHIGKFLNGYGDEPFDEGRDVPPGWSAWHSVLRADTHHYFYGYTLNNNGVLSEPIGDPGSWDTREYIERDDPGCPNAALNGKPCFYQTDIFNRVAWEELSGTPVDQPFYLQMDYTAPHGDFRRPSGTEPAP